MKLRLSLLACIFLFTFTAFVQAQDYSAADKNGKVNPAMEPIEDVAGLPRALLIGDSISIGYTLPTRASLAGKANVHRIPENGGDTNYGLKKLQRWLGAGKWEVIHFNFGLHDLKFVEGKQPVPIEQYEKNLTELVKQLKATGAKLIWRSTTPVPEGNLNPPRKSSDVIAYNKVAQKIMRDNHIAIHDLYSFALPRVAEIQIPVNVHFTPEGSKLLAHQVAASIEAALPKQKAQTRLPNKPNIILILTDDQGYGDLGRHGNPILQTPNLDRLYDESVRFTDFHVSPTCAPTRSALMSGRHDFKNGVTHTILERERMTLKTTTIAQVLKSAGYTTGIFGKWHLGDEPERRPDRRGFDEMFIHGCGGIGQTYPGTCGDAPGNSYFDPVILHNDKFEKTNGYCTDVFFGQAMQWMKSVKGQRPFFAYITPNAPHAPLDVSAAYEKMYADKLPQDKAGKNTAKFFGMIHNIDENVGKLLALLKEQNIERETLVIFMNDNGGTEGVRVWNVGMRGAKNTPYLGGTRAMSFWRWPGTLKPKAIDALSAHVDVFPTLAELAAAKLSASVKAQVEGRSLTPLLKGANVQWADRIFVRHIGRWPKGANPNDYKYVQVSVRNKRYQLVSDNKENIKRWALYDLQSDPGETNDIAAQHPDIVKALDAEYDKWWAEMLPMLDNEDAAQPAVNPYHEHYWKQYKGAGPNNVPPGTKPVSR